MKKLLALPIPPSHVERYIAIRDSKRNPTKNTLVQNHAAISGRYQDLADRAANQTLHGITASPLLAISTELRDCYGGKTKALLKLKDDIEEAQPRRQLKYCPYCGTTTNETYDHYLPAVTFPEYSVHALNLVPSCFRCNTIKDRFWLDGLGNRYYLHPFLDDIPDVDFLEVELITVPPLAGVGARFRLEHAGMDAASWALIRSHFKRLHLIYRYNDAANDEIAEMLEDAAIFVASGGQDVQAFLTGQATAAANVYGRSHWRAVLLRALAAHPDLDHWIAGVAIPVPA